MFNEGGRPSTHDRREVDLYVYVVDVEDQHKRVEEAPPISRNER